MSIEQRIEQFKTDGYTIFPAVYDQAQMQHWREVLAFMQGEYVRGDAGVPAPFWIGNMLERAPRSMMTAVTQPDILDFAEAIMGPFVQLDNLTLVGFPSASKADDLPVATGWHRDRWAKMPNGTYDRPLAINAISYFQELTDEFGPLRVVPGSHVQPLSLESEVRNSSLPDEQVLHVQAGDVVVIHNALLHSGSPNTSGQTRYFFSLFYNLTWMKSTDNHDGPNTRGLIRDARERNDHRMLRLLGQDDHLEARANSGFQTPDEPKWKEWAQADRDAIKGE